MKKYFFSFLLLLLSHEIYSQSQAHFEPKAYISINATIGRHQVVFKEFEKAPGLSFGFNVNLGIYAIRHNEFSGGLQFTLLEGASYNKKRRQLSEDFNPPNSDFDKHIIFKFAQFRGANIGWFSHIKFFEDMTFYHNIGFGIFGTTEKDQLYDFGMHNSMGFLLKYEEQMRLNIGIQHDTQIGTGNPNYGMHNLGFLIGGSRSF